MANGFKPTVKMAANARKGLELRAKFGRGGTEVGVDRAEQIAAQVELTEGDVKSMHSYLARHAVDKDGKAHESGLEQRSLCRIHRVDALGWRRREGVG